jgi:hypothetical protein
MATLDNGRPAVTVAGGTRIFAGPPAAVLDPVTGRITVAVRSGDGTVRALTETVQSSDTYLFAYRDQNNVQKVLTVNPQARAAPAEPGSVRTFTEQSLPKAGK